MIVPFPIRVRAASNPLTALMVVATFGLCGSSIWGAELDASVRVPEWIWAPADADAGTVAHLEKTFRVGEEIASAELRARQKRGGKKGVRRLLRKES